MAWNAVVTVDSIVKRERGGALTLRLKLYDTDPPEGEPLFEDTASENIKSHVEGESRQELVNRARNDAGKELLEKAKVYIRIAEYAKMVNTKAVESAIEAELNA